MNLRSSARDTVELFPGILEMNQPTEMTLFRITHWSLIHSDNAEGGTQMVIVMKRKIMSEMMTTYFPSALLMLITFATTFFKPFFFEAALSVNLTTMLVMTTIFISKMESLPPTSATKMIDYWLILCQLVPFAEVVLLTAMEYIRDSDEKKEKTNGDAMCDRLQVVPTTIVVHPSTPQREEEEDKLDLTNNSLVFSLPSLKMIGKLNIFHPLIHFPLAETKGLPLCVLLCFVVYFVVAAKFYHE